MDQEIVQQNILKTLQGMKGGSARRRRSEEPSYQELIASRRAAEAELEKTRIRVNEFISVSELADLMKIPATQIVQFAFKELGLMVTVNQRLDFDQIELIASENYASPAVLAAQTPALGAAAARVAAGVVFELEDDVALAHAAIEHRPHLQFAPDRPHVRLLPLERERRDAG